MRIYSNAILLVSSALVATAARADDATDTIVVTAIRAAKTARAEEKAAPNLINVQSAEEIVKYPDFNAAEALGRVPGVSLSIDTGEGRFVNIRGLDSNLNGTTFGGVTLLNTQPGGTYFGGGGRAVELDTVPIGAIDRLVVRKTGLPDQEAEGLGGSVELTPRTAVGVRKPFFEGTIGGGYQSAHKNGDVFVGEAAIGTAFGPEKTVSVVLYGSYHTDKRGFDDVEPAPLDAAAPYTDVVLDAVDLRRYNYNRRRFGFGGELDFDPTPQSHFYIRATDAGYTESVNRQLFNYSNLGDPGDNASLSDPARKPNGYLAPAAQAALSLRDEQETHLNFITAAGGRNDLGGIIVDYQLAYTSATYHRDYDYNSSFDGPTLAVSYDNISNSNFPRITPIGFNPNDPTQFTLGGFRNTTERAHDREYSGVLNVTIPTQLLSGDGSFKFGGKLRFRDKIDQPNNLNYADVPATPLTALLGPGPFTTFYGGNYAIGYSPDASTLRTLFSAATPTSNLVNNARGFFNDTENIYAGFAQYQGSFGKLNVLAGVRVENTDGTYRGTSAIRAPDKTYSFVPSSRKSNYTNFFPTVQLRYEVMPDLVARATYSTGIGRPGFLQLLAGARVDAGARTVAVGNPDLKPTTANSFDAQLEYYLPDSGVLSVGIFDKEFRNYIIQGGASLTSYPGITGPGNIRLSTFNNVRNAYARGVEGQYTQKFSFLPEPFDGLGFTGNITYVDSKFTIRGTQKSKLPGTSSLTYNVGLFYEAHKAQVRLSLSHVGAAIFQVGGDTGLDIFEDARTQLDLTTSYQLFSHMAVYFNARNLNNSPLRYYEGLSYRTIQREFYKQSYEAGFRFKF